MKTNGKNGKSGGKQRDRTRYMRKCHDFQQKFSRAFIHEDIKPVKSPSALSADRAAISPLARNAQMRIGYG